MDHSSGEGNRNPLQYSCLDNPADREAWWATIYGVAQSRTRLKRLSSSSLDHDGTEDSETQGLPDWGSLSPPPNTHTTQV